MEDNLRFYLEQILRKELSVMQTMNSAIEQYMEMVTLQVDNCRVGSFFDVTVVVIEEEQERALYIHHGESIVFYLGMLHEVKLEGIDLLVIK